MKQRRGRLRVCWSVVGLFLLVVFVHWPVAVSAAPVYGGHATVLNVIYPELWDPHMAGTIGPLAALSPLYNQLVEFNPLNPSEITGDLAARWEVTEDGLTYTFYLHDNVKWWDGKDLTAEDVVFSLKRMVEPGKPRPRVGLLRPYIKDVALIDRLTVKVTLNFPAPAFLPLLAVDFMKIVPKHVVEAGVDINVWENIVGSGPFKIKSARRGDSVHHEKNPNYFKKGRPYLDALSIVIINDKGTAAAAIKAGRIQMTTAITGLEVDDVLKLEKELKGKYSLYWQPPSNVEHFFGNVEREPWKDLRIIKALRLATDRYELQKAFGAGHYLMGAPFPPDTWWATSTENLAKFPGYSQPKNKDIETAKALLKEAGYDPPAKLGKRVLTTPNVLYWPDVAQLWVAQMRKHLGLEIEIKVVDTPTAVNTWVSGDYDLGSWGYAVNIDDPDDYVTAIYGPGSRNFTRWKHPEFLKLLDQQRSELNRDKRQQILHQMDEFLLNQEEPYVPLFWARRSYLVSDKVRTEAGPFMPAKTAQVMLKWEHVWLEK
jgi:peptide/nickel transport system substrate-binding protein